METVVVEGTMLDDLPPELVEDIGERLDAVDLSNLARTARTYRRTVAAALDRQKAILLKDFLDLFYGGGVDGTPDSFPYYDSVGDANGLDFRRGLMEPDQKESFLRLQRLGLFDGAGRYRREGLVPFLETRFATVERTEVSLNLHRVVTAEHFGSSPSFSQVLTVLRDAGVTYWSQSSSTVTLKAGTLVVAAKTVFIQ